MRDFIYLDSAATTATDPMAIAAMTTVEKGYHGNPHSVNTLGIEVLHKFVEPAKFNIKQILSLRHNLDIEDSDILFTSGGSDANNLVITSICNGPGDLITSMGEHLSIEQHRRKYGTGVDLDKKTGQVNIEQLLKLMSKDIKLVSLIAVSNETGAINNIKEITTLIKKEYPDALIHTDFVQGFLKTNIDLSDIDLISISAHKIHGPKGIGCIWASKRARTFMLNLYRGTPSVSLIAGFHTAIKYYSAHKNNNHIQNCADQLIASLEDVSFRYIIYDNRHNYPGILALEFPDIDGLELLLELEQHNIIVARGSACSLGQPSKVIEHLHNKQVANSTIRFSFNHFNTLDEIKITAQKISEIIKNKG